MKLADKVVAITGGASGIGRALAVAALQRGAGAVAIADLDPAKTATVAAEIGASGYLCDVGDDASVATWVNAVSDELGPIDIYCSNAGIGFSDAPDWTAAGCSLPNWQKMWQVNVMAHVHATRALLPLWQARKSGHLVITASAAGLLSQIGDAAYSATKHAAVGYAEAFAINHGDEGIGCSCLCPQGVRTPLLGTLGETRNAASVDGILSAEEVANATWDAVEAGVFMVTPHATARTYFQNKATDHDRWIGGMKKFRRALIEKNGGTPL